MSPESEDAPQEKTNASSGAEPSAPAESAVAGDSSEETQLSRQKTAKKPSLLRKRIDAFKSYITKRIRRSKLSDWIIVALTVVLAYAAISSDSAFHDQLGVMANQLAQMKSGAGDTHNLTTATQNLATAAASSEVAAASAAAAAESQAQSMSAMKDIQSGQLATLRSSVSAAEKSAKAAQDSVQSLVNGERARFYTTAVTLKKTTNNDPHPTIDYGYINMGRTAALVKGVYTECVVTGAMIPQTPQYIGGTYNPAANGVGAGAIMNTTDGPLFPCKIAQEITVEDYAAIAANTKHIVFISFVYYIDVYGHSHVKRFGDVTMGDDTRFRPLLDPEYAAETDGEPNSYPK